MRAICPTCDTAYTIPDARIGAAGRKVRCVKCGEQWHVMPEIEDLAARGDARPLPTPAPPPAASERETVDRVDEEHWASVAQHFDTPSEPAADPEGTAPPEDTIAPSSEGPSQMEVAGESTPTIAPPRNPISAASRRFALRPTKIRSPVHMPKMPAGMARALPFFGPLVFFTAVLVLLSLFVFRSAVVAAAPSLSGLYAAVGIEVNLRGLTFGQIETLREIDNGQPVLVVEGSLANPTKQSRDVPALRFALRDGDNQELYAWSIDPKATSIAAGDTLRFRTRLVAPPDRAADLQIRFVERRNQRAELK